MALILPKGYDPVLSVRQTQEAIKYIRDTFQKEIRKRNESGEGFSPFICIKVKRVE